VTTPTSAGGGFEGVAVLSWQPDIASGARRAAKTAGSLRAGSN
jgi:hypothetical protein